MPLPLHFEKKIAESFLDSLANNKPLECPEGGWSKNAMLAAAGACHFVTMSQGPILHLDADYSTLSGERKEAIQARFFAELDTAIGVYSHLTMLVRDGDYDGRFDSVHEAIVSVEDGAKTVTPTKGLRRSAEGMAPYELAKPDKDEEEEPAPDAGGEAE